MNLIEKAFAAAMFIACLVLLARLLLGARLRARFDAGVQRGRNRLARAFARGQRAPVAESAHAQAERVAREAIERARRRADAGQWDGNVYRPDSFGKRKKKKRDLH